MKRNYLFGTLAFAAMLASCNNEIDTVAEVVEQEVAMEEVVGATLVSEGLTIKLDGMDSRAANGQWLAGDKLGLAWYNVESSISAVQTIAGWGSSMANYLSLAEGNYRIFANHKFTAQEGSAEFVTESNVYQGAHFVYFPYKYENKIAPKVVEVNSLAFEAKPEDDKVNTSDASFDMANKAFNLSAQDFISGVNEDGVLEQEFVLEPMVNALRINATPKFAETADDLKKLTIKKIEVTSGQDVFANKLAINPAQIPAVVRDPETKEIKSAETKVLLNDYAMEAVGKEYGRKLERTIAADYDLSATRNMNIFTLPTSTSYTGDEGNALSIKVHVESEQGLKGHFDIKRNSRNTENNKGTINTLEERLGKTADYTLTKIVKTKAGSWTHTNLNVELTEANVNFTWNIDGKSQWDDAVALAEEIGKDVEFKLVGDVDFTETINFPSTCKVTVKGSKALVLKGAEMEWPADANVDLTAANITVEKGTTLSINGTSEKRNALVGKVDNHGTISLNEYASVGAAGQAIDNEHGRVEVVYGSYAYATGGIVAFEVLTDTPAYQINNLIADQSTTADDGQAKVNTLVVNEGNVLDLNKENAQESTYDPYAGTNVTIPAAKLIDLSAYDVDIEMNGGTIKGALGKVQKVMNVDVLSGTTNSIVDVTIKGNLTVAEGTEVTIDATPYNVNNDKYTVYIEGDIKNVGTINANATIETRDIYNEVKGSSKLYVGENYTVYYTNKYMQGGLVDGEVLKKGGASVFDGTPAASIPTADANGVITISTAAEFAALSDANFSSDITVKLAANIDMNGFEFKAINVDAGTFTFDGGGKTLSNINFVTLTDADDNDMCGPCLIHGNIGNGIIVKDLYVERAKAINNTSATDATQGRTAIIVGYTNLNVTMTNVHVLGSEVKAKSEVGALIGFATASKTYTLTNCSVKNTSVIATALPTEGNWGGCPAGGMIGFNVGTLVLSNCESDANAVAASDYEGTYVGSICEGAAVSVDGVNKSFTFGNWHCAKGF